MPHPWKGQAWRVQNGMMFLRPDSGYADAGGSSSRSGPGPGRFCGCFYVLLLAWRVDPSVDISWILEAPSPYDRSGIVSRYGPTVSVNVREWCSVELTTIGVGVAESLRRSVLERSQSVLNVQSYNRPAEPTDGTVRDTVGDPYAVPCRAVPRPRRAGLSTNRARSLPRRTGRGNSRSRRALRLSPSRGPPLLRGVRSYHCVPRTIAPSAGSDGTYT